MFNELLSRYPSLVSCRDEILDARNELISCYERGGKLLLCGNGGSCSDCEHISGELLKGFLKKRPLSNDDKAQMKTNFPSVSDEMLSRLQKGLPAIPLTSLTAVGTAFSNDVDPELVYAQAVLALGRAEDVLIAISTSGNSRNAVNAAVAARALGMKVISLTGEEGGKLKDISHITIRVPEKETFKVQELHLPVYHYLCGAVEDHFFSE